MVVETALDQDHGSATGNTITLDNAATKFDISMFQQIGRQLSTEEKPVSSTLWQVKSYCQTSAQQLEFDLLCLVVPCTLAELPALCLTWQVAVAVILAQYIERSYMHEDMARLWVKALCS